MKDKYKKRKGLSYLKGFFSEKLLKQKSDEHFKNLLKERWSHVQGKRVLDAGCGYCEFFNLKPDAVDLYGVDVKKIKHPKIKFGDLNKKVPYSDNYFDTVVCFHVLEHLKEPEIAILEFLRVLKNGGRVVLTVPNYSFKKFFEDYTHVRPYPKIALHNILVANGFKEIEIVQGHHSSQIISALFLFFPSLRWKIEKILGKFFPYEITAIARCYK
ncbi:MAG: class I SAM-dependent methyltransferase [Nanoarchaeota archaeon]|nr:class I SAM-dependent methyltransferase [Nanoarchaeota archaeon]MBU1051165.1 class I SAM-dependent methyltransferase [Nanoarchaeota archaeon]